MPEPKNSVDFSFVTRYSLLKRFSHLPKYFVNGLPFLFLIIIIPITYWFEIWVVLPSLYSIHTNTLAYCTLFIIGHFLLINILGNLIGIVITDTSIRGRIMPSINSDLAAGYCEECVSVVPPRAYHCPTCKVCILRRDHHCAFTACCIGHFNYRYFLMFLLHMFIAISFCLPFNIIFLWDHLLLVNLLDVAKLMFPVLMLFYGLSLTTNQGYLLLSFISVGGLFFIGVWFYFHFRLAASGRLVHELRKNITVYDQGFKENLKEVLGEKWLLVWVSPFIKSEQLCDGINFSLKSHAN